MKYLLILAVLAAGAAAAQGAPERAITDPASVVSADRPAAPPPAVAALFDARSGAGAAWSADGASADRLHQPVRPLQPLELSRGRRRAGRSLTHSDDRQTGQVVSPDGKTVVFQSDHGGDELYDLFAVPDRRRDADRNLTDTPDISETDAAFSPDGRQLAFDRKLKRRADDQRRGDGHRHPSGPRADPRTDPTYSWRVVAWTADGKTVIADRANLIGTRASAWRVDVASGKVEELTPASGDVLTFATDVSPDGRTLAVSSNQGGEQTQAALFSIATHKFTWLSPTPWEQTTGTFSPDGGMLVYRTNADGRTAVSLYDLAAGTSRQVALPPGVNDDGGAGRTAFSPDSRRLLVSHVASNTPSDYWIYDIASGEGAAADPLRADQLRSGRPAGLAARPLQERRRHGDQRLPVGSRSS